MRSSRSRSAGCGFLHSAAVFALIFAALWLAHLPLLRLPYFWDEGGYFVPAARDLLLSGELIPRTTLSNAHPPLVMMWLALCWKLTTFTPMVTRTAMLLVAASGLTALWRLGRLVSTPGAAAAAVLLTALTPTVFIQSAMAQLDIAAFALVLWMLDSYLRGRRLRTLLFAALAAVAKETTVAVTLALAVFELAGWAAHRWRPAWAVRWRLPRATLAQCGSWFAALLPLAGWYAYHLHRTGHLLGNPDYLRYNVGATLNPWRIGIAAVMRLWHATGYMNLFVLTAAALLVAWSARHMPPLAKSFSSREGYKKTDDAARGISPEVAFLFSLVVLAQVAEFSLIGGALLARYMIPALPFVILLSVDVLRRHAPGWRWWIAGCAAAFLAALFFNPPWSIAPEDNLSWARFVRMHQEAARYVEQHHGDEPVLTAWPASDELTRPFLGYVNRPLTVVAVENFTAGEVLRAARQPESYGTVLAFSTKLEPSRTLLPQIPAWNRAQTRYFDYHRDLPPKAIAAMLGGRIEWQQSAAGEWVAVIAIDRLRNAGSPRRGERHAKPKA